MNIVFFWSCEGSTGFLFEFGGGGPGVKVPGWAHSYFRSMNYPQQEAN